MTGALERAALRGWAGAAGLLLWTPAVMVPLAGLPFQPLDLLVAAGWPILAAHMLRLPPALVPVIVGGVASLLLSWLVGGGLALPAIWTLAFALPFLALVALATAEEGAARAFLAGFLAGASLSALLFLAQLALGADRLDFRNNLAFRLPPQYGRGFALFPEVSTFAAHGIIALCATLALSLHPALVPARRRLAHGLSAALAVTLLFTQSTSLIVILPVLAGFAIAKTTRASFSALVPGVLMAVTLALLLSLFVQNFYLERLESASAERSAAMRLSSVLGGLSVLFSENLLGMGVGRNELVAYPAFEVARMLGLSFGALPQGVNAQIVSRLFEEGWPAVIHLALCAAILVRALRHARAPLDVALAVLAVGSALVAATVIGYRGIYGNWLWLAIPAGLLARRAPVAHAGPAPPRRPDRPHGAQPRAPILPRHTSIFSRHPSRRRQTPRWPPEARARGDGMAPRAASLRPCAAPGGGQRTGTRPTGPTPAPCASRPRARRRGRSGRPHPAAPPARARRTPVDAGAGASRRAGRAFRPGRRGRGLRTALSRPGLEPVGKGLHHLCIDGALERNDPFDQIARAEPGPPREFGMLGGNGDLVVLAKKAHQEPFLFLPPVAAIPDLSAQLGRQVIAQPSRSLGLDPHQIGAHARLLLQLPQGGIARAFALVDSALGHLPGRRFGIDALAGEYQTVAVDQNHAHVAPIRQFGRHRNDPLPCSAGRAPELRARRFLSAAHPPAR